jgi:DNA-binding Lrp family transcriptional regulator
VPTAIVLINAESGAENDIFEKLKTIPQVSEVYVVYGVYDLVAKVEADSMESLKEVISSTIRRIPKVKSTLTMIVMENRSYVRK